MVLLLIVMNIHISLFASLSLSVFSFHHGFAGPQQKSDEGALTHIQKSHALSSDISRHDQRQHISLTEEKQKLTAFYKKLGNQIHTLTSEQKQTYIEKIGPKVYGFLETFQHERDRDAQDMRTLYRSILRLLAYGPPRPQASTPTPPSPGFSAENQALIHAHTTKVKATIKTHRERMSPNMASSQAHQIDGRRQTHTRPTFLGVLPSPHMSAENEDYASPRSLDETYAIPRSPDQTYAIPRSPDQTYAVPVPSPRRVNTPTSENGDYDTPCSALVCSPKIMLQEANAALDQKRQEFETLKQAGSAQDTKERLAALEKEGQSINPLPNIATPSCDTTDSEESPFSHLTTLTPEERAQEKKKYEQEIKRLVEEEKILNKGLNLLNKDLIAAQKKKTKYESNSRKKALTIKDVTTYNKHVAKRQEKLGKINAQIEGLRNDIQQRKEALRKNTNQQNTKKANLDTLLATKKGEAEPHKGWVARLLSCVSAHEDEQRAIHISQPYDAKLVMGDQCNKQGNRRLHLIPHRGRI
ncbi:hypothetical protein EIL50_02425 [bacterium NHP-B]|nr:hypothetical protein EIL50_02425 [bacterium NHP-B]